MRIVIAPDSFKECLSASNVAIAIEKGIKKVDPKAEVVSIPMADGGEGTVEALVTATSGNIIRVESVDALSRPIGSFFGALGNGKTAVIEMASASGLELLTPEERNPLVTSTFGTGLLIKAAIDAGFQDIIIGIGGSATNDGGAGMAQALGYKLLDQNNKQIGSGGEALKYLDHIDCSAVHPFLRSVKITVACDVQNPLVGPSGATSVYGPQKGATPEMIDILEKGMIHYSKILQRQFGVDYSNLAGAGAAGGLGAALMAFCNAKVCSGFELIAEVTNLEQQIGTANLVFTGEGKIDEQTVFGKTISGIAKICKTNRVPLVALAGMVSGNLDRLYEQGLTAAFSIANRPMTLDESKTRAATLLSFAAEQTMRIFHNSEKN